LQLFSIRKLISKKKKKIAVSGIEIEQLTSSSVTFTMFPSLGAISYTAQFMDYQYIS